LEELCLYREETLMAETTAAHVDEEVRKYIDTVRARMTKELATITSQLEELAARRAAAERELAALDAYEAARLGKAPTKRSAKGNRQPRGSVQTTVLEIIQKIPAGISRGDIIATVGSTGSKASEQSISSALSALKKAGRITSKDGKYVAA
jgi:hypothetical protein